MAPNNYWGRTCYVRCRDVHLLHGEGGNTQFVEKEQDSPKNHEAHGAKAQPEKCPLEERERGSAPGRPFAGFAAGLAHVLAIAIAVTLRAPHLGTTADALLQPMGMPAGIFRLVDAIFRLVAGGTHEGPLVVFEEFRWRNGCAATGTTEFRRIHRQVYLGAAGHGCLQKIVRPEKASVKMAPTSGNQAYRFFMLPVWHGRHS